MGVRAHQLSTRRYSAKHSLVTNCAKHIIDAGLTRVVYIEPYAKSKALEFHDDSIIPPEEESAEDDHRVRFEPFSGIGPRRF